MNVAPEEFQEVLETAREENLMSPYRRGNVVFLPVEGDVLMTGDLHDHRNNFAKLLRVADLDEHPHRHIVLHELIHGDHIDPEGAEDSWKMLYQAARLKSERSNQVHFLLANHDLAQVLGEGISKNGTDVCEAFKKGLKRDFPTRYHFLEAAVSDFLLSLPLAIRCPNGIVFTHSLPREDQVDAFDFGVFDRELTGEDFKRRTGAAYQLIWGRGIRETGVEKFLARLGADLIITGHQPQENGFEVNGPRHLIIASDHNQGVFVPLGLSQKYDMDGVLGRLRKFVSVLA